MSGLGERGARLRRLAQQLSPAPEVPPFYTERPDLVETWAIGWHMRRHRQDVPEFLGYGFIAAELKLRELIEQGSGRSTGKKRKARAQAS